MNDFEKNIKFPNGVLKRLWSFDNKISEEEKIRLSTTAELRIFIYVLMRNPNNFGASIDFTKREIISNCFKVNGRKIYKNYQVVKDALDSLGFKEIKENIYRFTYEGDKYIYDDKGTTSKNNQRPPKFQKSKNKENSKYFYNKITEKQWNNIRDERSLLFYKLLLYILHKKTIFHYLDTLLDVLEVKDRKNKGRILKYLKEYLERFKKFGIIKVYDFDNTKKGSKILINSDFRRSNKKLKEINPFKDSNFSILKSEDSPESNEMSSNEENKESNIDSFVVKGSDLENNENSSQGSSPKVNKEENNKNKEPNPLEDGEYKSTLNDIDNNGNFIDLNNIWIDIEEETNEEETNKEKTNEEETNKEKTNEEITYKDFFLT